MPISLNGQVALVTGGGRGIGRSVALDLSKHGARVVVNDSGGGLDGRGADESVADTVAREIKSAGGEAIANHGNVADYEAAFGMVKQAIDTWGRLDIVVSNAGFLRDLALHNMKPEDWQAIIDTHLTGAYNVLHHAWPVFRQQSYGRVVLTSSNSGFVGNFGQANYGAAKGGLVGLMNVAKLEGAKYNVMVNCLGPGAATRMTENLMPKERLAAMGPDLVAPGVTYLCSRECTDSGIILEASGGSFGRAAVVRNRQVKLANPTADEVAAHWSEITSLDNAEVWWSVSKSLKDYKADQKAGS
jgi:NAD(P)-dependent dehydrogenase (short-subunit alcohol dehydrogenase family)